MMDKVKRVTQVATGTIGVVLLMAVIFTGCSGGGGGASSSDPDMKKIADELTKLGNGHWEITTLEREGDVVNIGFKVQDDPGKVTFKEGQAAEEAVHKILPKATGKLAWVSVQGIGLRTVLLEAIEGGGGEGAAEGQAEEHPEGHEEGAQ
ncbi:MAG: hypothetical protein HZA18_02845 [Nitrospirae bacterium]|nr:hypothetical protein [Nitrospirota bacterium]